MYFVVLVLIASYQSATADSSVCYPDLGCITLDMTWYNLLYRPINFMPFDRSVVNTTFVLRTREAPTTNVFVNGGNLATVSGSNFKASRPTKFVVHGFLSSGDENWYTGIASALLAHGDYNVIIVRWGGGANCLYSQATANTRLVGLEVANLVNKLVANFGVKASDVHLIGHSLGAHVCGYAGKKISGLGRITGLDPAGPYFQGMPAFARLDSGDAQFVDVIHTNGVATILQGGFGLIQPVGHVDFYPNGGTIQPGCNPTSITPTNMTSDFLVYLVDCNHMRAILLFIDSLTRSCQSVAYECASYATFKQGKCASCGTSSCAPMGISADKYPTRSRTNVKMYLDTTSSSPYCENPYQITVNLANPSGAKAVVNGALKVTLSGASATVANKQLTTSDDGAVLIHGQPYVYLVEDPSNAGKLTGVTLNWNFITTALNPLSYCVFCNKNLYVSSVQVSELNNFPESARLANTFKLCPSSGSYASISSGASYTFSKVC